MSLKVFWILIFITLSNIKPVFARSATATAQSLQTVFSTITIQKNSDLNFGEAPQGDPEKTVLPGRAENFENASFEVFGDKGSTFTIILPTDNIIKMILDTGGPNKEIPVNKFSSYPQSQITMGSQGQEHLFVGATRAKLSPTQKPGKYIGNFTISIVY